MVSLFFSVASQLVGAEAPPLTGAKETACGGKPSFPSTSPGDLRELPMLPLRGEGSCGVGGASRDSAGLGAMEEGLISRGDRELRLPRLIEKDPDAGEN